MKAPAFTAAVLLAIKPALAGDTELQRCAGSPDPASRLRCYDALASTRAKDPPLVGKIQICRAPGAQGTHQEDAIDIPAGASVINFGEKSSLVAGSLGVITLATIEGVTLRHGEKCVTAQARVKENPKQRSLRASDNLEFGAQGGSNTRWAELASYKITIAADFK